ncbi:hypothetical protein CC85DRAFT_294986 [Cutaneotrichosporon oleaginosum]|uniref:Nucleotide-diphospho-sugar transferase n=1 Tax=Cutaneotrichosporon oleaginosum TaxID=879819 RepID=A0A0J0XXI8_9TREE|nr:uncharacterized protein CC85DRAFT_294986 [Cutaneotrichosporon oleaginosum]KLT45766.1 hypothetical protein CC85DRAFT_294986 [Cutaneotrichosporon oleaginosum]TXT04470.1 hypothetical protein COLE_07289 [Cutaneotrichosporon oleaginosum]
MDLPPRPRVTARAGRRLLLFVLCTLVCTLYLWHWHTKPEPAPAPASAPRPSDLSSHSPFAGSASYSPFYGGGSTRAIDLASDPLPQTATLAERLDAWEAAPASLDDFARWNGEQCAANIHNQQSWHMTGTYGPAWAQHDVTTVLRMRFELISHMRSVQDSEEMRAAHNLTGRGIVMLAGDGASLMRAYWSVSMLRMYRCNLPIYVYHYEEERPAVDDPVRLRLEAHNVVLVAVEGAQKAVGHKSYHLKAHAMILSPFRHVLYLDSDSIPVRDPGYMFEAPNYVRLGVYMTPDYWKTPAANPLWAVAGVKCRNEWENEAGQLWVDKARHMDALLLARYMLERHAQFFKYSDGDKDILLRWALLMLRKRWGVPGRYVAAGAYPADTATGFCAHSMIQHDAWGRPLTVHWNLLKEHYAPSVGLGSTWGRSKRLPLFDTWPATPATARLHEPAKRPDDADRRGLGDIDCDMLADADEAGYARAPAQEMVMRRAAREQGVNMFFHGGLASPFCVGLDYADIRPQWRKDEEEAAQRAEDAQSAAAHAKWNAAAAAAERAGTPVPPPLEMPHTVKPDWSEPFEVVQWADDEHLAHFEQTLYTRFLFDVRYSP